MMPVNQAFECTQCHYTWEGRPLVKPFYFCPCCSNLMDETQNKKADAKTQQARATKAEALITALFSTEKILKATADCKELWDAVKEWRE